MKKLNIVFSVVLIAVAAFFFFYADTFKMLPGQTEIGPGAFPKAVCVGLAVCGILLIIQELRKDGSEKAELFSKKLLIGLFCSAENSWLRAGQHLGRVCDDGPAAQRAVQKGVAADAGRVDPGACGAVCHLRYVPEGPSAQRNPFRPVGLI